MTTSFCPSCGNKLENDAHFCSNCGTNSIATGGSSSIQQRQNSISEKSGLTAFLLCLFLGSLGVHRFYVGKIGTGILMLLTSGGLGIWYLYDLITIVCNNFTDNRGQRLEITRNPTTAKTVAMIVGSIIAAFILFFVFIFLVVWFFVGGLATVAQDQLTALRAGDYEKAYSYTSSEFKKEVSFDDFKQFINENPSLKTNISASFPEREVNNNYGTIKGTLRFSDDTKMPIEFQLIKEDGNWKIIYIDLKYKKDENSSD